jgi:predicted short-subunit dehydrogenase-like oxidoreductase (DUF2520 family)
MSIAAPEAGARALAGAYFAVSGDDRARDAAEALARDVGGLPVRVADKRYYHLAATLASNLLYPLFDAGAAMMRRAGVAPELADKMLLPLVRGSVENLAALGAARGMTGAVARGDAPTVARHLEALSGSPEILAIYVALQRRALELAREAGGKERDLAALAALLYGDEAGHT